MEGWPGRWAVSRHACAADSIPRRCRLWEDREQKRAALEKSKHLWAFWMSHGQLELNLSKQNPPSAPKPALPLVIPTSVTRVPIYHLSKPEGRGQQRLFPLPRCSTLANLAGHYSHWGVFQNMDVWACPQRFSSDGLGSCLGTRIFIFNPPGDCHVQPSLGTTAPQQSHSSRQ